MRCGVCKRSGDDITVDHVRNCDGLSSGAVATMTRDVDGGVPRWPASDKQIAYVIGLQEERILPDEYNVLSEQQLKRRERDAVSSIINLLKTFPKKEKGSTRKQWSLPAGRYAIKHSDTGEWWFFEVGKPTEGRWAGYTFIKRLVGAPGQYRKVDMTASERVGWLSAIEDDPKQAMVDYGMESGVCGRCSSPLTDPESLARGIGPVCAGKMGWF